jgi:AcrR family transcriptional regulator
MAKASAYPLSPDQMDAVAERADVSARSVRRYFGGHAQHGSTVRRIERALRELEWAKLVRPAVAA